MTDVMREMIAQLMGAQREEEEGRKLPPYHSRQVCRLYLIGCCPREKLLDTRLEPFVTCRKMHEPAHKADYQRAQEQRDHFYDVEAFEDIEHIIRVIDGEVEKIKEKVQRDAEGQQDTHEFMKSAKANELTEKINATLAKVEELGNEGKVQESMDLAKSVEEMKRRKTEIEMQAEMKSANPATQRLRVCADCGAQLNVLDHESRLADHYGGRMHLGMVDIREWYREKKEKIEERREAKRKSEDESGAGSSSRHRSRSRSPVRNRSPRRFSPDRYDRRSNNDRRERSDYHRNGGNRDWRDRDDRGSGRFRDDRRDRYQDRRERDRTDRRRRY